MTSTNKYLEEDKGSAEQGLAEAERYCERNDVPYVSVENAAESFAIQKELASSRPPDV